MSIYLKTNSLYDDTINIPILSNFIQIIRISFHDYNINTEFNNVNWL